MRSQVYLYTVFILLIITQITQLIQNTRTIIKTGEFSTKIVWQGGQSCWFGRFPVQFTLPECGQYVPGSVLQITLFDPLFTSGGKQDSLWSALLPTQMKVQHVTTVPLKPFSWLWWASEVSRWAHTWREWLVSPFNSLPPDQSMLARKLFLGSGEKISPEGEEQITRLGLQHIFAVSGSHVSMFLVFIMYAAGPFSRGLRFYLAGFVCLLVLILAGTAGSVVRAVVMAVLAQWARQKGRQVDMLRLLAWTGLWMLALNLAWIWDIGWQLSFLAMIAILWVKPRVDGVLSGIYIKIIGRKTVISRQGWFSRMVAESFQSLYLSGVVMAVMLPLLWWHFKTISFAGILVMFVGWWIFPLVFSSLLLGLLVDHIQTIGLIHQSLTEVYSVILYQIPLTLLAEVMKLDQKLSILLITAELLPIYVVCVYCVVLGVLLLVADRVGSGQARCNPSTGYSPLLSATHGVYY